MDQEITSGINRALFHQKGPAHIRIMNARRNANGAITAMKQTIASPKMALQYDNIIITAARKVDKGDVDVEENESWEMLKIHSVPLVQYMGKGSEGLQKMREDFVPENEGIVISSHVRWLANPCTIRVRRQNGEIAASSLVFVVKGSRVAQSLGKKCIMAAGVWYRDETYTNEEPDSRCELSCVSGHIKNKCGSKPQCGYCSGHHWTSDHKCNVVGCTVKQGSLCSDTLEKCPNCTKNHIVLSSRCGKNTAATYSAQQSRTIWLAGRASMSAAQDMPMATVSNRVMLGPRPEGVADAVGDEEEMADVDKEEQAIGGARDIAMAETETATRTANDTETEIEMGAVATNY